MNNSRRAGPVTLALGLIFIGLVMLVSNITGSGLWASLFKFWPLLLMGLGLEYFIKSYISKKKNEVEEAKFHFPTVFIILLVTFTGFCGQQAAGFLYNRDLTELIHEAIAGNAFNYTYQFKSNPITVKPGVTKVRAEDIDSNVDIQPSSDGMVHVNASIVGWGPSEQEAQKRAELVRIEINEGDVISISRTPNRSFNGRRQVDVKYRLEIPDGVEVEIDNGSGNIKAYDIASNIFINNQNGIVSLKGVRGNVISNCDNGQLSCRDIYGTLDVKMVNGTIEVVDPHQDVKVSNQNGRIELYGTKPVEANFNIINRNGEIVLRIAEKSNVKVTAQTNTGALGGSLRLNSVDRSPDPNAAGRFTKGVAVLGSGKGNIDIVNETGNIIVDKY